MKNKKYTQNTSIEVNIKGVPQMVRVSELEPNDVFFCKRCSSIRIVVGKNCYDKTIKDRYESEDEKLVVYYDLSMKHIGTIPANDWVIAGNKMSIEVE